MFHIIPGGEASFQNISQAFVPASSTFQQLSKFLSPVLAVFNDKFQNHIPRQSDRKGVC